MDYLKQAHGSSKLFKVLRRWGHSWNHKRVYRWYCALNLNKRRRGKKRLPTRNPEPLSVPATLNQCWSIDFMSDSLFCGRRFRTFMTEVRQLTESWMTEYNDERPHDSLEDLTLWEYLAKHQRAENSNQQCN